MPAENRLPEARSFKDTTRVRRDPGLLQEVPVVTAPPDNHLAR